ncbi:fimbrial protein [Shewanella gaetbuli]|uniref:Fimbrial protein n=1 Tax=Shewanella gaetbuli TaxID=220752 RepID=A0A9X2CIT6_9GAMM|nr:fimbrial protein [Shewanella gaetbuli]MCL1143372.1 fimbrial protein [Shewanella gaetbuli]
MIKQALNNKTFATVSTAAVLLSSLFSASASAADGTVTFNGIITDQTCTVSATSTALTVDLGTVGSAALAAVGDRVGGKTFSIELSACPASVTAAGARFVGNPDAATPALLATTGTATGVGVRITNAASGSDVVIGSDSEYTPLNGATDVTLNFIAEYEATAVPVTAGTADSTADFSVIYQ